MPRCLGVWAIEIASRPVRGCFRKGASKSMKRTFLQVSLPKPLKTQSSHRIFYSTGPISRCRGMHHCTLAPSAILPRSANVSHMGKSLINHSARYIYTYIDIRGNQYM